MSALENAEEPAPGEPLLDGRLIGEVLSEALRRGGDFAEVYAEDRRGSSAVFEDGKVSELSSGTDRGAGIRVVSGGTTGFAHVPDLTEAGLMEAARVASAVARSGSGEPERLVAVGEARGAGQLGRKGEFRHRPCEFAGRRVRRPRWVG